MSDRLDLSDISLPEDEADKPADYGELFSEDSKESGDEPDKESDSSDADKPEEEEEPIKDENTESEEESDEEDESEDEDDQTEDEDEEDTEDELSESADFHNHPDWQKMQDRLNRLESENRALKGTATSEEDKADKEMIDSDPYEVARQKLTKDLENGWKPQDRVEERKRLDQYIDAAKNDQVEALERQRVKLTNTFNTIIDDKLDSMQVSSKKDRKAVREFLSELRNKGLDIAPTKEGIEGAIDFSVRQLKATERISSSKKKVDKNKPQQSDESKEKEAKQREAQKQANKKAGKKKSSGEKNNKPVINYKKLHSASLDDLVMEASKTLE